MEESNFLIYGGLSGGVETSSLKIDLEPWRTRRPWRFGNIEDMQDIEVIDGRV